MFPLNQDTILQAAFKEWTATTNRNTPFALWLSSAKQDGKFWGA